MKIKQQKQIKAFLIEELKNLGKTEAVRYLMSKKKHSTQLSKTQKTNQKIR